MRISDWSSDVCSSDLPVFVFQDCVPCVPSAPSFRIFPRGFGPFISSLRAKRSNPETGAGLPRRLSAPRNDDNSTEPLEFRRSLRQEQNMIAKLKGLLDETGPHWAVIDRKSTRLNSSH